MRYAEFCAGVGGFRLGIQSSDLKGEAVFVNEIDDSCEKTYEKNFHQKFDAKDIFEIVPETLPAFDMLCAGFPCQPFLIRILKDKQPSIVFLENVPNLIRHDGGKTYKTILKSLDDAGYMLSSAVLDCSYFGVPQSRSRVYIIGLQKEKYGDLRVEFSSKKTERTPLRPFLIPGDYSIPISSRWQEYIDLYTGQKSADELSFDVPRTRCALERIASNCDIQDCVFQVRSSGVRALSLDEPFPTFTVLNSGGGAHIPILSKERRHLSIQEIKRIMGFPEWYDFSSVSRTDAAKELANAVSPPVITSICNDIARAIHTN